MASLSEVVKELQGQNETLIDVSKTLTGMLKEDQEARKQRETDELKQAEEDIESRRRSRVSAASTGQAKTFGQGVSKGLGLDTLMGGLRAMVGPFVGAMGGALGGLTLGGLLGMAVGKLFWGSVGAFLGSQFLSDELVNKIIPDVIEDINITDNIKIGDISAEIAGALALLFGPKLISGIVRRAFSFISTAAFVGLAGSQAKDFIDEDGKKKLDDETKKGKKRFGGRLIRGLGIGSILAFVGTALGDEVGKLTGSQELGDAVSAAAQGAALGSFFGPKGMIIGAALGLAFSAGSYIYDWLVDQDNKTIAALKKGLDDAGKKVDEALSAGDFEAAKTALETQQTTLSVTDVGTSAMQAANLKAIAQEYDKIAAAEREAGNVEAAAATERIAAINKYKAAVKNGNADNMAAAVADFMKATNLDKNTALNQLMNFAGQDAFSNPLQGQEFSEAYNKIGDTAPNYDYSIGPSITDLKASRDPYLFAGATQMMQDEAQLMSMPLPAGTGEQDIQSFLQTGQFPKFEGIVPKAVVQQTISPEDTKGAASNNVMINNVDNSNNSKTVVNKGGDSPMYLGGSGMNAIDLRYERKHLGMLGFGSVVGNVF